MQHQELLKGWSLVEGACLALPPESESQKVSWTKSWRGLGRLPDSSQQLQHKGLLSKKVRLAIPGDASEKRQDGVESTGSTCFKDSTRRKHFDAPAFNLSKLFRPRPEKGGEIA